MNSARLDVRLEPETKRLAQQAAELRHQSLSQFVTSAITEAAQQVVVEHQVRELSRRDGELFLRLLEKPPRPKVALRKAARRYKQLFKD